MTDHEKILWSKLRDLKQIGYHFRRQSPFRQYTLDFVEHDAKLVVELDGSQHGLPDQVRRDAMRDRVLQAEGYVVVRFFNSEVKENLYGVTETIVRELRARHPHPPIGVNADWRPPHRGEVKDLHVDLPIEGEVKKAARPLPRKGLRRLV